MSTRAERRMTTFRLHTAKLVHARLLGIHVPDKMKEPTRQNIHNLQILINMEIKR